LDLKGIPKLKFRFTTEREQDPGIMKITITNGVQFKPPTPPLSSFGGETPNFETFFSKVCQPTIIVGHGGNVSNNQKASLIFEGSWHC
jgi:hypothetical protein